MWQFSTWESCDIHLPSWNLNFPNKVRCLPTVNALQLGIMAETGVLDQRWGLAGANHSMLPNLPDVHMVLEGHMLAVALENQLQQSIQAPNTAEKHEKWLRTPGAGPLRRLLDLSIYYYLRCSCPHLSEKCIGLESLVFANLHLSASPVAPHTSRGQSQLPAPGSHDPQMAPKGWKLPLVAAPWTLGHRTPQRYSQKPPSSSMNLKQTKTETVIHWLQ